MPPRKKTQKSYRIYASGIGEYYLDMLTVEASLKQRTEPMEAGSLLCAKLQERTEKRNTMVKYLAEKRGIEFEEMWALLLSGDMPSDEEVEEIEEIE